MRKLLILISTFFLLASCTIHKKYDIKYKTESELTEYYKSKGVTSFLLLKDYASLTELYKLDRVTIPQNIVFDVDGYEIETFNDKLCANHTVEFLKKYNEHTELKKTKYHIDDYLAYFKSINGDINIDEIKKSKKIRVFANTATYGDHFKSNGEALDLYNHYRDKYQVYIVNLDYSTNWSDKPSE